MRAVPCVLFALAGAAGCFSEPENVGTTNASSSAEPTTEADAGTESSRDTDETGPDAGGTSGTTSGPATDATADGPSSGEDTEGPATRGESGTSDEPDPGLWREECRTPKAEVPCAPPIVESVSCLGAETQQLAAVGCGDIAETRITLNLAQAGDYVVALIETVAGGADPVTSISIIDQQGNTPLQCFGSEVFPGPIAQVALDAPVYDVVVTTPQPATSFPFVLRHVSSLCEVPPDCCDVGDPDQCTDAGLRECVEELDDFCTDSEDGEWDARCVNVAVAACGAACDVLPEG